MFLAFTNVSPFQACPSPPAPYTLPSPRKRVSYTNSQKNKSKYWREQSQLAHTWLTMKCGPDGDYMYMYIYVHVHVHTYIPVTYM